MGAKSDDKTVKNQLENQCRNLFTKKANKCVQKLSRRRPRADHVRGVCGPGVPGRGKAFLRRLQAIALWDINHHKNNIPAKIRRTVDPPHTH